MSLDPNRLKVLPTAEKVALEMMFPLICFSSVIPPGVNAAARIYGLAFCSERCLSIVDGNAVIAKDAVGVQFI